MMTKKRIPDYLKRIFDKDIDESKLNEGLVIFIFANRDTRTVTYTDIAEEFSLLRALHRMYIREEIQVKQSRIELIGSKSKRAVVKKKPEEMKPED